MLLRFPEIILVVRSEFESFLGKLFDREVTDSALVLAYTLDYYDILCLSMANLC